MRNSNKESYFKNWWSIPVPKLKILSQLSLEMCWVSAPSGSEERSNTEAIDFWLGVFELLIVYPNTLLEFGSAIWVHWGRQTTIFCDFNFKSIRVRNLKDTLGVEFD